MAGNFNLDDYIQVNDRIKMFYEKYPDGSIQTEIISNQDGQIIFKAYAYKTPQDERPATGHAMEKEGSTFINKTSHIENCETSAIGRALAIMGFGISKSVASREEVENARLQQDMMKEKIPKETAKIMENLVKEKKGNIASIFKAYGIKSFEEMTVSQCADLKTKMYKESA